MIQCNDHYPKNHSEENRDTTLEALNKISRILDKLIDRVETIEKYLLKGL